MPIANLMDMTEQDIRAIHADLMGLPPGEGEPLPAAPPAP
jgi:hypothetical protein